MELNIDAKELKAILEEYEPKDTDSDGMLLIKERLHRLDEADRIIMILYAELQSCRQLGRILGVSHTTIEKQLRLIREQLRLDSFKDRITL